MNYAKEILSGIAAFVMAVTYLGVASLLADIWSGRCMSELQLGYRRPADSTTVAERRYSVLERRVHNKNHSLTIKRMKVSNRLTRSKPRKELVKQRVFAYLRALLRIGQWYVWVDDSTQRIGRRNLEQVKAFLSEVRNRIDQDVRGSVGYGSEDGEGAEAWGSLGGYGKGPADLPEGDEDQAETTDKDWRRDRLRSLKDLERTLELLYSREFLQFYRDYYKTPQSSMIGVPTFLTDEDLENLRAARSLLQFMDEHGDLLQSHSISLDTIRAIISDIVALEEGQLVPSFIKAVAKPIPGRFPDGPEGISKTNDDKSVKLQLPESENLANGLESSLDSVAEPPSTPSRSEQSSEPTMPRSAARPEPREFQLQESPPAAEPPSATEPSWGGWPAPDRFLSRSKRAPEKAPLEKYSPYWRPLSRRPATERREAAKRLFRVGAKIRPPTKDDALESRILGKRAISRIPAGRHLDHARFARFIRTFPSEASGRATNRRPTWHRFTAMLEDYARRERERLEREREGSGRDRVWGLPPDVGIEGETAILKAIQENRRLAAEKERETWDKEQDRRVESWNLDAVVAEERSRKIFQHAAKRHLEERLRRGPAIPHLGEDDPYLRPPWDEPELSISAEKQREIDEVLYQRAQEKERIRLEKEREAKRLREEQERIERLNAEREREAQRREEAQRRSLGGLRKPKSTIIPPIEAEWMAKAKRTIAVGDNDVVCKDMFGTELTGATFKKLLPAGQWLNDEAINGCLRYVEKYINEKAGITDYNKQTPKCIAINSFFWSCFQGGANPAKIKRQLGNRQNRITPENFMDVDTILIPQCSGLHWTLAVIKPRDRIIAHIDSLSRPSRDVTSKLLEVVKIMLGDKYHEDDWTVFNYESPRQTNGYDCGVFTIANGVCFGLGVDPMMAYSPSQLNLMRARITGVFLNEGFKGHFSLDDV